MRKIKLLTVIMAAVLLAGLVGCRKPRNELNDTNESCRMGERDIYFASEKDKEAWRAPLERLLSNPIVDDEPLDPDAPSVEDWYKYALFDITRDGVPELISHLGGGSRNNALLYVYDIMTGEKLTDFESSNGSMMCFYYDTVRDGCWFYDTVYWRFGWLADLNQINTVIYDREQNAYRFVEHFVVLQNNNRQITSSEGEQPDFEVTVSYAYYIDGTEVAEADYRRAYDEFTATCIPIPGTALQWVNTTKHPEGRNPEDYRARGRELADRLLSTDQKFIIVK